MLMGEVMHLLFVFIFVYSVYCCPTQWPYQMMFESLNSNMTGATNEAWTVYPYGSTTVLYCGSCCLIFIFLCNVLWKTLLSVCPFSFAHGIVCPSSIYSFWLPLWYLQTLPKDERQNIAPLQIVIILSSQSLNILKGYSEAYNLHTSLPNKRQTIRRQKLSTNHRRTK